MNQEVPWTWVAMIAIAFISWIFSKIQEATVERQRAKELKKRRGEARGPAEAPPAPPPLPKSREPQPAPDNRDATLRELIEALGGAPQPVREPERHTPPPPARAAKAPKPPRQAPVTAAPTLSAAERAALERIQAASIPGDSFTSGGAKKTGAARRVNAGLPALLRSPAGLRQAIVLKELLDKPVSLR